MYSGHNLIYAFKLSIEDIKHIFDIEDEESQYDIKDFLDLLFSDQNIDFLEFLFLPCCYFKYNCIFLGVNLGSLKTQYRAQICEYNNFEEYYLKYSKILLPLIILKIYSFR